MKVILIIKKKLRSGIDGHMHEILKKGSLAFVLKFLGAILTFGLSVLLSRYLGANGVGQYFLALTVITLVAVLGRLGMDNSVTRFVAANAIESKWSAVKGVVRYALLLTISASAAMTLVLYVRSDWLARYVFREPELAQPLSYMALAIVPFATMIILARALQGLKNVRDSMIMQSVLVPAVTAACITILVPRYGVNGAAVAYTISVTTALLYGCWHWARLKSAWRLFPPSFPLGVLARRSPPLLGAMLVQQLMQGFPVLVLGILASSSEVGQFSAANRTAALVGLVLVAANAIIAPKMAAMFQQGDMEGLGRVSRQSALLLTGVAAPLLLIYILLPDWIMGMFGSDFTAASSLLVVMALGQTLNVMTGSVGVLLMMTGHERSELWANVFALVVCATLCGILIPLIGAMGAAIANAVSIASVNLLRVRYVYRLMGIITIPAPTFLLGWMKVRM